MRNRIYTYMYKYYVTGGFVDFMLILAATEDSASLKCVKFVRECDTGNPESPKPVISTYLASKGDPIIRLLAVKSKQLLFVVRKKGHVGVYDLETFELIHDFGNLQENIVGLFLASPKAVCTVTADGKGALYDLKTYHKTEFQLDGTFNLAVNCESRKNRFLVAGEDTLPQVFDLDIKHGTPIRIWKAKNPPKTRLGLREPNSVIGACFANEDSIVTSTAHGKLRLYDINSQSRSAPVQQTQVSKYRVPSLACLESKWIVFGDSQSKLGLWGIQPWKLLGHFPKVTGSTRALAIHNEFIAAGGLDRYLRVFVMKLRETAGRVYLGEEINSLAFIQDDNEETLEADEAMWKNLSKRRRVEEDDFPGEKDIDAENDQYMLDPENSSEEIISDSPESERSDVADSDDFCGFSD